MRPIDRIEALREAGSISEDEARQLIAALGEGERSCSVNLPAAELIVTVADVPEPHCEGDEVVLVATPEGVRVEAKRLGLVEGWIGRSFKRPLALTLPPAWALNVDLKAGSVRSSGVATVRGRVLAGSWEVHGASFVDLSSLSGHVTVTLRPQRGEQRIEVGAGDAHLTILPGSSVSLEARVDVGSIDGAAHEAIKIEPGRVGARWSQRFGDAPGDAEGDADGGAKLDVRIKAGRLTLRHQEEHP